MKPYKDLEVTEKSKIRIFESNVDSGELHWHRDRETRLIEVIDGNGWQLQLDNELPIDLLRAIQYQMLKFHCPPNAHKRQKSLLKFLLEH